MNLFLICFKKWKEIENKITEKANEARDNLKYLTTFKSVFEPLYQSNIPLMMNTIPKLMSAIRLIINCTRYYNQNEKISTLFVKVR